MVQLPQPCAVEAENGHNLIRCFTTCHLHRKLMLVFNELEIFAMAINFCFVVEVKLKHVFSAPHGGFFYTIWTRLSSQV